MRAEHLCLVQSKGLVALQKETHLFSRAADQRRPLLMNLVLLLVERHCDVLLLGDPTTPLKLQLGANYIQETGQAG